MKPPARIRLRLLGRLALSCGDDSAPIRLSTRKSGALLAYLAMSPEQTASREELATLLWGSCSDQQARQSLRQALALLRKELRWSHFLAANTEVVRLQPGLWSVDAHEFEELSKSPDPDALERAARLFGGEFLTGLNLEEEGFDEWVRAQRQRVLLAAGRLCEAFATRPDLVADGEQAVSAVERLLALDPLREDWQRLALTLYARYRGKTEALAQAEVFAAILQRELGVAPEKETRALIERIRADEIGGGGAVAADRPPSAAPPEPAAHGEQAVAPAPRSAIPQRWSVRATAAVALTALVAAAGIAMVSRGPLIPAPAVISASPSTQVTEAAPEGGAAPADPSRSARPPTQPAAARSARQESGVAAMVVMPFTVVGERSEQSSLLADVMTDDLTNLLSRVGGLRVISRQTAMTYRGQPIDPTAVGVELGVRYVLEGNVQVQDNRWRVNVELVDTKSRVRVLSGRFERPSGDHHGIHDEIVNSLGRELQIEVFLAEGERGSKDPDVHELIFKGWNAINASGKSGVASLRQAEKYFTQALERDPDNAAAQRGLAAYHAHMAIQLYAPDPAVHLAKAEAILQPLIERYPNSNGPHAIMGLVHVARENMEEAARSFERSIALNPSHVGSHAQFGRALVRLGRPQEGLEHILYAMRLSPRDPAMGFFLAFAGSAELELKHYAKAIDYFDRALVHNPGQPRTSLSLVAAHALSGNINEARLLLEQLQKARPHLTRDKLIEMYAKGAPGSQLRQGIQLALGPSADSWESPPLPSRPAPAPSAAAKKGIIAIAVLPFTTYGETDGSIQQIADMVTDDLTNTLSRVANLRVISRQTARSYQGQRIDIAAIGAELQVRYVLEGSMRMHGGKLRVNAELVDPVTRLPAWSARIERDSAERHGVQDEIVGRLARELHFEIYKTESERASKDPDVAELNYIGWTAILEHGTQGLEALKRAETAFSQALARNPHNWGAMSGLGAYHTLVGSLQLVPDWKSHVAKGEELLRQSIREQPHNSSPHFFLSIIQRSRGQAQDAIESLSRCLEIAPSQAPCHAHVGHTLVWMGRAGEGREHIKYALRLSPRDLSRPHWLRFAGEAEIELGQFERALDLLRQSYAANPRQPHTLRALAATTALSGKADEARKYLAELKDVAPHISPERLLKRPVDGTQPELIRGLRLALAPARHEASPDDLPLGATSSDARGQTRRDN